MSQKNFASYGDMETLVTEIADKCGPYTEISYEDWLQLTPYQQEHGRWDVIGVPGADGKISIDLMTKLWENPDPTQTFAAQDISLANSNYDLLLIIYKRYTSQLATWSTIINKGASTFISFLAGSDTGYRKISPNSDTSYAITDVTSGNSGVTNAYLIPYQIYGIKLHHTVEIKAIAPTVSTLAENCMLSDGVTSVETKIGAMETNFQDGVDAVYDAVVAKGSTPASHSLSDIIAAIAAIPTGITPSGNKSITANGTNIDVTQYATVSVAVPNSNSATYTYPSGSKGEKVDLGATNSYRYVNAANVYAKGKADGDVKHTVTVQNVGSKDTGIKVYRDGTQIDWSMYSSGQQKSFTI